MRPVTLPLLLPLRAVTLGLVVAALPACGPRTLKVVMNAENNSGQGGMATLTEGKNKTHVELVIGKSDDPRPQPVHIHTGHCGEIGPKTYDLTMLQATAADPLHFTSVSDVEVTLDALLKTPYSINAHDVRDFALYVSCGNLGSP